MKKFTYINVYMLTRESPVSNSLHSKKLLLVMITMMMMMIMIIIIIKRSRGPSAVDLCVLLHHTINERAEHLNCYTV